MAYTNPTTTAFKAYFDRDFPYGSTDATVKDTDILKAIANMILGINQDIFIDQPTYTQGALLLSAHYLVMNLRASAQGIAGQYNWLQTSKNVGSVSESFQIPQRILDNPELAWLSKTYYGEQYLMMVLPNLTGQMTWVCGRTNP